MRSNIKVLDPDALMEPLPELLEAVDCVPLVISGSSMTPFLVHGRDTVYLSKIKAPVKRGDMILYRRSNGVYVLHRVYRVENGLCTMVGDAQTLLESGIRPDQMLAQVTAVRRKGKLLRAGSFWWFFFEKIWIRMVPLRPWIRGAYTRLKKLFD